MSDLFGQVEQPKLERQRRAKKAAPVYRAMSLIECARVEALAKVSFFPGTAAKRFARDPASHLEHVGATITDKQAKYLEQLSWKFRRQMPRHLVPEKKPEGA